MDRSAPRRPQTDELLALAKIGDANALGELLERQRANLERMIALRLDPALRDRVGASDVVQEALVEACTRFPEYARAPRVPFLLWVRLLAGQRLQQLRRFHLHAQVRDARREHPTLPAAHVQSAVELFAREQSSPTQHLVRAESAERLRQALESMEPLDREVLVLRHFEGLTAEESAHELGITTASAAKRHLRALQRLRGALGSAAQNAAEST